MATKKRRVTRSRTSTGGVPVSSTTEELLLAALERGDESFATGRYLITYRESAAEEGLSTFADSPAQLTRLRRISEPSAAWSTKKTTRTPKSWERPGGWSGVRCLRVHEAAWASRWRCSTPGWILVIRTSQAARERRGHSSARRFRTCTVMARTALAPRAVRRCLQARLRATALLTAHGSSWARY